GDETMKATFQGSIVAMVTPFRNGKIDEPKVKELVELHVKHGTDAIVPCGTTGESPTLSHDEHHHMVELTIAAAAGRIPVIAGTGSNSTAEAIALTKHAERAGATGALVVNPYYNKPTQEGLYRHFRTVAEATALPILVYNIQGRTAVNIETPTMERLARDGRHIVGVKEASGALELHYTLFPLARAAFLETNPIPIKEAMGMVGMLEPEFRLPMCRMGDANREKLRAILTAYGLVK